MKNKMSQEFLSLQDRQSVTQRAGDSMRWWPNVWWPNAPATQCAGDPMCGDPMRRRPNDPGDICENVGSLFFYKIGDAMCRWPNAPVTQSVAPLIICGQSRSIGVVQGQSMSSSALTKKTWVYLNEGNFLISTRYIWKLCFCSFLTSNGDVLVQKRKRSLRLLF